MVGKSGVENGRFERVKGPAKKKRIRYFRLIYGTFLEGLRIAKHWPQLRDCPTMLVEMEHSETIKLHEKDSKLWFVGSEFVVEQVLLLKFDAMNLRYYSP